MSSTVMRQSRSPDTTRERPVPAAVVRIRTGVPKMEVLCCFTQCKYVGEVSGKNEPTLNVEARALAREHLRSVHSQELNGAAPVIDAVRIGPDGWTGLSRAIAAERMASYRRLYKTKG